MLPELDSSLIPFLMIVPVLFGAVLGAALLTWWERRVLGFLQNRPGPNRYGPFGIGQIVADLLKLATKEDWVPPFSDPVLFTLAPTAVVAAMLMAFSVVPMGPGLVVIDMHIGLLFFLAMTSLSVYSVLLGGLASNSKYALLGGLRSAAQMVTYEVFMGLSLMGVVMIVGSFNLSAIVRAQEGLWFFVPQFPALVIFIIAGLAEAHRLPFDLPEAEHELTAGFHTEYSGMKFALIFLGEYLSVILTSAMIVTLFFGGWLGPWLPPLAWFTLKTFAFVMFFILVRAAIPRPRYDQLMILGWKYLLPLTLVNLLVTGAVLLSGEA
ncbi:MAG: NADH-quinone oxidoreductase subunit NuoH [Gammaproteobacteria bacterium]|nr:NADH-quinone oxidoreductase subunit NuoH [Gammaproteobacteria bacterium]